MDSEQLDVRNVTQGVLHSCVWFLLCVVAVLGRGDRPVCDIPPVEEMGIATITCYLPEEVIEANTNFTIFHLSNGSSVQVMQAVWLDNTYAIALRPGYRHLGEGTAEKSRIFRFQILSVNESHIGKYSCRPFGYDDSDVRSCELVLIKNLLPLSNSPDTQKKSEVGSFQVLANTGLVAVIIMVLIVTISVIAYLYFVFK